jgi:hypothetical protein
MASPLRMRALAQLAFAGEQTGRPTSPGGTSA